KDGIDGAVGPQGLQGIAGTNGADGKDGVDGAVGPQGLQGIAGVKGDKGDIGATGAAGAKGDKGDVGATGAQGLQGIAGVKGDKGDIGATGAAGAKGDKGDVGATGAQGLQGIAGLKGDKGDIGATGAAGAKGDKGDAGATGATGARGLTGAQGLQGIAGVKGDKGDIGATGPKGDAGNPAPVYTAGTGIAVDNTNRIISALNTTNLWNANQLQGRPISTTAPTGNQVLAWSGSNWAPASIASEPWRVAGTTNEATSNTQNIYQMGRIGIGTNNPSKELSVVGNAVISKSLQIDGEALGDGTVRTGLYFGPTNSGEGITSNRASATNGNVSGLDFWTGNSKRMSIINNGNVGIGKLDPGQKLDVVGTIRSNVMHINNGLSTGNYNNPAELNFIRNAANDRWILGSSLNGRGNDIFELVHINGSNLFTNRVFVYDRVSSSFAINQMNANTSFRFYVNGAAGGTTTWSQSSDRRFKKDITPITNALDKIMKIDGVGYNWKADEFKEMSFDQRHQLGVIAQDIEKVLPEAVTVDDKGYYSVSYTTIIPVLVEAVKEQQNEILSLQKNQKEQQEELNALKKLMQEIIAKK
ncbi:tail fiber domain-containing protein, partial [Flavobacterium sp. FlaQc-30]|uniref:tail fiber domain-containing protein n=1 Tax=Flavobacterium sp. FlaQc-30 TaxID=3374179 RepID=UPI0037577F4C